MRRQGPRGDPGRRRHRPGRLSERRVRLRHPVADAAGDAPAARRAGAHAADRPPRRRVVPELRPLENPPAARASAATCRSTDNLPYAWWDSPNIHFCTIKDFRELCDVAGAKMERAVALNAWGTPLRFNAPWWFWNLFGEQAVFLLSRRGARGTRSSHRAAFAPYGSAAWSSARRIRRDTIAAASSKPTSRRGSTGCRGAASTPWSSRRSASPGFSTASR